MKGANDAINIKSLSQFKTKNEEFIAGINDVLENNIEAIDLKSYNRFHLDPDCMYTFSKQGNMPSTSNF